VTRGEIWLAQIGRKRRPVLVLTRPEVIEVRELVTVAEITSVIRGLAAEVPFDHEDVGLREKSVVNCDGLHTIRRTTLTQALGTVDRETMEKICWAVRYAVSC
jgi:mRNA interferase MazF